MSYTLQTKSGRAYDIMRKNSSIKLTVDHELLPIKNIDVALFLNT